MSKPTLLLVNGPNLGALGTRAGGWYGTFTLADVQAAVRSITDPVGWSLLATQSDHEGDLVGFLQAQKLAADAAIVNPGALMTYGWSLLDALIDFQKPWIEVHISNVFARDEHRRRSILAPVATGFIAGLGLSGYTLAATYLVERHGRAS